MQNTPTQPKVLGLIAQYTKQPVNMGSKLSKGLCIGAIDIELLRSDLEEAFAIEITRSEAMQWKKSKNVVSCVNLCIHRRYFN
jgi:hypothetical protein